MTSDPAARPWQLLITGGEDAPGQASTLTLEQAEKLLKDRELSAFASGAAGERQRIHDMIHSEILPNWDTNGVEGKPGVQWLSRTDWVEVANFILGVEPGYPTLKRHVDAPARARWEVKDIDTSCQISHPYYRGAYHVQSRTEAEKICAWLNSAVDSFLATILLARVIDDLPSRRDWLNPQIERSARTLLGKENPNA